MSKSKRKNIKTKSSSKLHLKDFRHSFTLSLFWDVKNINVNEFENIDSVDLTRKKTSTKALFMFLIHWTVFLNKKSLSDKNKIIDLISFDYSAFLINEQIKLEEKTWFKNY